MAEYLEKSEQQAARAYSPAVITQGGRTVWLAGQTATRDTDGKDISGNFDAQVHTVFALIDATLRRLNELIGQPAATQLYVTAFARKLAPLPAVETDPARRAGPLHSARFH